MIGVIITAHGRYASGIATGLELVVGKSDNLLIADFEGSEVEEYKKKLNEKINELLKKYEQVAIATDIAGGTPYNTSVTLTSDNNNIRVFSGVNFQLAYELLNISNLDKETDQAIETAKDGIGYFAIEESNEDTSFEGGI